MTHLYFLFDRVRGGKQLYQCELVSYTLSFRKVGVDITKVSQFLQWKQWIELIQRKKFFHWKTVGTSLTLSHKSPIVYLDTNFIIINAFKLKIKFKLCGCTESFTLAVSWEIEFRSDTTFWSYELLPRWWNLRCLLDGVLLTSMDTGAQGGEVSRLDGGFPPAWWHQALVCLAAAADSGHNPGNRQTDGTYNWAVWQEPKLSVII